MNVEIGARRRTIWKFTNDRRTSQLQWMWKEMQEGAQFENSQMIGCQVDCNKCGMNCRTTQILRLENVRIANWLQSMWKEMQDKAKFQNQKMVELQVDCNECGIRCKKTHNLKIHKWSEDKPIAMNVERDAGGGTIWKFPNDRMSSWLQQMWNELQDNAQFQG